MKLFMKYVLRSMTEKKGRLILLLIALTLSTGLMVASTGLVDIILNSMIQPQFETFDNRKIRIEYKDENAAFFTLDGISYDGIDKDSMIEELRMGGTIYTDSDKDSEDGSIYYVTLFGKKAEDIEDNAIQKGNLKDLKGASCMISERSAKVLNKSVGDTIAVAIAGETKNLKVAAINAPTGSFYMDTSSQFTVIVPYEYLSKDLNAENQYNIILANTSKDSEEKGIEAFNKANENFNAVTLFDEESFQEQIGSFVEMLYAMLVIVAIMSILIIYSTFKLIIIERMNTIGTFLSQGATAGKVKMILYMESIFYGILGGVFGALAGIGMLYAVNRVISPLAEYGIYGKVVIYPRYIVVGFACSIVLSLISTCIPVHRISKLQVKEVILDNTSLTKEVGWRKFMVGVILFGLSFALYLLKGDALGYSAVALLLLSAAGVIFLYPKLIDLLSKGLYQLTRGHSKSVIYAINNLRTSKVLLGNITFLMIALLSIIFITSLGTSLINVVTECYTDLEYTIEIDDISNVRDDSSETTSDYIIEKLKEMKATNINPVNYESVKIYGKSNTSTEVSVYGVDIDAFADYCKYLNMNNYKTEINQLKKDDSGVIITTALQKQLGENKGDQIKLFMDSQKETMNISGIIDGKLFENGVFILMKNTTLEKKFGIKGVSSITFTIDGDVNKASEELKPILREVGATQITRDEQCKNNLENNQMLVDLLSIFSMFTVVIAAFGIANNISIGFIQRKKEFVVFSSVGMPDSGRNKMLLAESIATVTWAMFITTLYSLFGMKLLTCLVKAMGFQMEISLDAQKLPIIYLASLAIVLITSIPIYFKSRKFSIMDELKYE